MRPLAVDGDILYGDRHVGDGSKYDFVAYNLATGEMKDMGAAADAAAVSDGRLIWTTFTVENGGGGGQAIPGCGWSIAHWRMYRLSPSDTKPSLLAKGDSERPGWGECADSMPPLIAIDGTSVAYSEGDTITVIDVASGRRTRSFSASLTIDALAMSNGSIAYLQTGSDPTYHDLMLAEPTGSPTVLERDVAWFGMAADASPGSRRTP